jgi:hypothetical protein
VYAGRTLGQAQKASGWAKGALLLTAAIAASAKAAGVVLAPGARGTLGQSSVVVVETVAGALAYMLVAMLVALTCGASFELARARCASLGARAGIVTISGLVLALASPAVVERLPAIPSLVLAVVASLVATSAGLVTLRAPGGRAVGMVLAAFGASGFLRVVSWQISASGFERGASAASMQELARLIATCAVAIHAIAALLSAAWIGTRSKWRGRLLANLAIVIAFLLTWLAARTGDAPSTFEAILRASLPNAPSVMAQPAPYLLGSIAAFLVPASILLAVVAIVQPAPPMVVAPLAFALLSGAAFDVPLQALLVTVAAQWLLLHRSGVQQPRSASTPSIS